MLFLSFVFLHQFLLILQLLSHIKLHQFLLRFHFEPCFLILLFLLLIIFRKWWNGNWGYDSHRLWSNNTDRDRNRSRSRNRNGDWGFLSFCFFRQRNSVFIFLSLLFSFVVRNFFHKWHFWNFLLWFTHKCVTVNLLFSLSFRILSYLLLIGFIFHQLTVISNLLWKRHLFDLLRCLH